MAIALRKRSRIVAIGAVCALMLAGCSRTADGAAHWNPSEATKPIPSADVDKLPLDNQGLSDILGAQLTTTGESTTPEDDSTIATECDIFNSAGLQRFVGSGWKAYDARWASDRPRDNPNGDFHRYAMQVAVIYADNGQAKDSLASATEKMKSCSGESYNIDKHTWKFSLDESNDDSSGWTGNQTDLTTMWRCVGAARARNNVLLRVLTCRENDEAAANTEKVMNEMSAAVWNLSAPNPGQ